MPRFKQTIFEKQEVRKRARIESDPEQIYLDLLPVELRHMTRDYLTMGLLDDLNNLSRQRSSIAEEECAIADERTKVASFMAEVDAMGDSVREDFGQAHTLMRALYVYSSKVDDYERELKDRHENLMALDRKLLRAQALLSNSFGFRTIPSYAERATKCKILV